MVAPVVGGQRVGPGARTLPENAAIPILARSSSPQTGLAPSTRRSGVSLRNRVCYSSFVLFGSVLGRSP
ncbi:hypothetical protein [Prochlorothrix hollandica]|uniref:hypothetical protein n=1 Tax=Prochlorothrix hollandica TaxID=1223 RepID=UPI0011D1CEC7|nr:hypothetical protein [Prochlorothrix hollandica]